MGKVTSALNATVKSIAAANPAHGLNPRNFTAAPIAYAPAPKKTIGPKSNWPHHPPMMFHAIPRAE